MSAFTRSAAVIIIGDEILSGKVEDSNARFLSKELFSLGWRLAKVRPFNPSSHPSYLSTPYSKSKRSMHSLTSNLTASPRFATGLEATLFLPPQIVTIPDEVGVIANEVHAASESYDLVITTGGEPLPQGLTQATSLL